MGCVLIQPWFCFQPPVHNNAVHNPRACLWLCICLAAMDDTRRSLAILPYLSITSATCWHHSAALYGISEGVRPVLNSRSPLRRLRAMLWSSYWFLSRFNKTPDEQSSPHAAQTPLLTVAEVSPRTIVTLKRRHRSSQLPSWSLLLLTQLLSMPFQALSNIMAFEFVDSAALDAHDWLLQGC